MKIKSLMILGTSLIVVCVLLISGFGTLLINGDVSDASEDNTSRARETIETEIGTGAKNTAIEIINALDGKMELNTMMVETWAAAPIVVNTAKDAKSYTLEELYEAWSDSSNRQFDGDEAMGDGKASNDINPEASEYLDILSQTMMGYPEIFFTDSRGYAIAANSATGDFDQGPDDWRVFKYPNGTQYYKKHDPNADGEGWWAAANAAPDGIYQGEVEYDFSAGVWGMDICVVIKDPKTNQNLGVLKAVYNFARALSSVIEVEELEADSIKMITPDGMIAATSESDKTNVMNTEVTVADLESYTTAKLGQNGFVLEDDETNEEKLIGFATNIENSGSGDTVDMICFVSYDPQTSLSPLEAVSDMEQKNSEMIDSLNQNSILILMAGIIIAIIVLVALISGLNKSLTRPLTDMADAAGEVKRGNMNVSVKEGGNNEVSELAKAFNQMVLSVRLIAGADDPKSK
jgi:HAMP domain-containing protein